MALGLPLLRVIVISDILITPLRHMEIVEGFFLTKVLTILIGIFLSCVHFLGLTGTNWNFILLLVALYFSLERYISSVVSSSRLIVRIFSFFLKA